LLVQILAELDLDLVSGETAALGRRLEASKVPEGLATGLAEILGFSTSQAEVQVTLEPNATEDGVVHVDFVADARFYSSQEVENFFLRARNLSDLTEPQVRAVLNRNLQAAGADAKILSLRRMRLRASTEASGTGNLDIDVVVVEGPEAEAPPDSSIGVAWLLVAAILAIALLSGVLARFYFKTGGRQEPTAESGDVDFEQSGQPERLIMPTVSKATKGKGAAAEETVLTVVVESCAQDTELELKEALDALDELGIDFVEDEESEQSRREALAAAGIEVLEDDDQSAGIEFKDSELAIEDALAAAGIELEEDDEDPGAGGVVAREREQAREEKQKDDDIFMV